eukprot:UN03791
MIFLVSFAMFSSQVFFNNRRRCSVALKASYCPLTFWRLTPILPRTCFKFNSAIRSLLMAFLNSLMSTSPD